MRRSLRRCGPGAGEAAAGKPAFTIAHDSTLQAIAAARPADQSRLGAIRGVGPAFISKHAAEVLSVIAAHPTQALDPAA